jgi:hypothetical protein
MTLFLLLLLRIGLEASGPDVALPLQLAGSIKLNCI